MFKGIHDLRLQNSIGL